MTTPKPTPPVVSGRTWVIAATIVLGAFMTQLDSALVNIGLATVSGALRTDLTTAQWIVSGYLLGLAVGLPACSWLCRRFGAGRVWLLALVAFTVVSAGCAAAPDIGALIAGRCLQGLAGGILLPAGQTVIAYAAGRGAMGRVMSVVGSALVLAPALGPIVGSTLLARLSWPWLFLVNLPVGAIAIALGLRVVPRGERSAGTRFDAPGFALIGLALPLVAFAIDRIGQPGAGRPVLVAIPLLLGVLLTVLFVRRPPAPGRLLDLAVAATPTFRAAAAVSLLVGIVQFGALVAWPLYLQIIAGDGLIASGVIMIGFALGSAMLIVSGRLTDRIGGGPVCVAGTAILVVSFLPRVLSSTGGTVVVTEICLIVLGIGSALSIVPASTAAYVAVRPPQMPDAVTIINVLLRVGGVLGASVVVVVIGSQAIHGVHDPGRFRAVFLVLAVVSALAFGFSVRLVRAATVLSAQPKTAVQ
ncbi:MFS transporter [Nocardia terpenica]|uniref:Putative MFS transporter n=1 Tax=Nocardia terpenica TaxID=455432 RepID=A0A809QX18_9NOCA|nr:MFS transporter [Nocardia terpenica]NQE85905.1 MFS transporter [Nocardia terpenica]BBE00927.1 putative MFS transporter [Nocardia terpenica]